MPCIENSCNGGADILVCLGTMYPSGRVFRWLIGRGVPHPMADKNVCPTKSEWPSYYLMRNSRSRISELYAKPQYRSMLTRYSFEPSGPTGSWRPSVYSHSDSRVLPFAESNIPTVC